VVCSNFYFSLLLDGLLKLVFGPRCGSLHGLEFVSVMICLFSMANCTIFLCVTQSLLVF
jgi:hypothetical protein